MSPSTMMLTNAVGRMEEDDFLLLDRFLADCWTFFDFAHDDGAPEILLFVNVFVLICFELSGEDADGNITMSCAANEFIEATVPSEENDSSDESGAVEAAEASQSLKSTSCCCFLAIVGRRLLRRFFLTLSLLVMFRETLFSDG